MKKRISHSALVLVRNCLRQYRNSYIELRRGRSVAPSLMFGGLWDRGLTAWHWGKSPVDRLARALGVIMQAPPGVQRETAKALILGYTARWGAEQIATIATQVEFTVPIVHPETGEEHPAYDYTGVLDGHVRLADGREMILESKTSSEDIEPGSTYWQRVTTLDPQCSMYLLGARQQNRDVDAVLYDVTKKPALRQGKKETAEEFGERVQNDILARPEVYFQRQEVVQLESEARAYQQDLWDYAEILADAERANRWPRNPDRCRQYGRPCDYLPVCTGVASLDDDVLFTKREKKNESDEQGNKRSAA